MLLQRGIDQVAFLALHAFGLRELQRGSHAFLHVRFDVHARNHAHVGEGVDHFQITLQPARQVKHIVIAIRDHLARRGAEHQLQRADLADVDLGSITTACALGYLDFRLPDLDWRKRAPGLAAWYAEFAKRPSMQKTRPDV